MTDAMIGDGASGILSGFPAMNQTRIARRSCTRETQPGFGLTGMASLTYTAEERSHHAVTPAPDETRCPWSARGGAATSCKSS